LLRDFFGAIADRIFQGALRIKSASKRASGRRDGAGRSAWYFFQQLAGEASEGPMKCSTTPDPVGAGSNQSAANRGRSSQKCTRWRYQLITCQGRDTQTPL